MSRVVFKSSLFRSNPHVVRYFLIDSSRTVEELIDTVAVAHGLRARNNESRIMKKETVIGKESSIQEAFSFDKPDPEDAWRIIVPANGFARKSYNTNEIVPTNWIFNIEVIKKVGSFWTTDIGFIEGTLVDELEAELAKMDEPCILLARGYQIHKSIHSISKLNEAHLSMEDKGYYYGFDLGNIPEDDVKFKRELVNKGLSVIGKELEESAFDIRMENTIPMSKIIESAKVDEIKECLQLLNIALPRNPKKANLVDMLTRYYTTYDTALDNVLKRMTYEEYAEFRNNVNYNIPKEPMLSDNVLYRLLLCTQNRGETYYAKEFLERYDKYMLSNGDEELICGKKAAKVLTVALRLYGVFSGDVYYRLCDVMFENEPQIKEFWLRWPNNRAYANVTNHGIVYVCNSGNQKKAIQYTRSSARGDADKYFYPSREMAEEIYKNGLGFSDKAASKLDKYLDKIAGKQYYYDDKLYVNYVRNMIFDVYHNDGTINDFKREFKRVFGFIFLTETDYKSIDKIVQSVLSEIRLVSCMGYTKEGK